jgi:hypothetical protein
VRARPRSRPAVIDEMRAANDCELIITTHVCLFLRLSDVRIAFLFFMFVFLSSANLNLSGNPETMGRGVLRAYCIQSAPTRIYDKQKAKKRKKLWQYVCGARST